jgi:hypothetical protein
MNSSLGPDSKPRSAGPSPLLVATILVPTLVLVGYLIVWAYRIREWTWFGLLVAAGIGLLTFSLAPELFAIRDTQRSEEWCPTPTMRGPGELPENAMGRSSRAGAGADASTKPPETHAPDRTA